MSAQQLRPIGPVILKNLNVSDILNDMAVRNYVVLAYNNAAALTYRARSVDTPDDHYAFGDFLVDQVRRLRQTREWIQEEYRKT